MRRQHMKECLHVFVGVSPKKKPCIRNDKDTDQRNQDPIDFAGKPCQNQHPDSLSNTTKSNQHTGGSHSRDIHGDNCQSEQFKPNSDHGNLAVNYGHDDNADSSDSDNLYGQSEEHFDCGHQLASHAEFDDKIVKNKKKKEKKEHSEDSKNQLASHAEFIGDRIVKKKKKRDKKKDKSDKKKVTGNKSGQRRDKQVSMGNAFGSSTKYTDEIAAVKTIDGSQFYTTDQNLEHNNPEEQRDPIVTLGNDINQEHLSGYQQQGASLSEQFSGNGEDDDAGTSVDDTSENKGVQQTGKKGENAQDTKIKLKEGRLLAVDKALEAAEYLCEGPVPLSPIPEAEIEVTPSPPPDSRSSDSNRSFELESPVCPPFEESQQTTSQSPTTAYHQHNHPPTKQQEADDTCKFPYSDRTNKKQTEISKASNHDIKPGKLQGKEVINDNRDQGTYKQVDEEISIKTKQDTTNGNSVERMEEHNSGGKTLTDVKGKRDEEEMEGIDNETLKQESHGGQTDCIREEHSARMHKGDTITSVDTAGNNGSGNDTGIITNDNTIITLSGQECTLTDKQQRVQGSVSGQTSEREDIKQAGLVEKNTCQHNDDEFEVLTDDTLDTSDTDMPAKSNDPSQKKGKKKSLSFRAIGSSLRSAFKGKSKSKSHVELPPGNAYSDIGARLSQNPTPSTGKKLSTRPPGGEGEIEVHEPNGGSTNLSQLSLNEAKVVLSKQSEQLPEVIVHEQQNGKSSDTRGNATEQPENASKDLDEPDAPNIQPDTKDEEPKISAKRPPVSGSAWSRLQGIGLKKVAQGGASDLSRTPSSGSLSSAASDDSFGKLSLIFILF